MPCQFLRAVTKGSVYKFLLQVILKARMSRHLLPSRDWKERSVLRGAGKIQAAEKLDEV
jgi:hypothetical protein